jgi:hypothetical protein
MYGVLWQIRYCLEVQLPHYFNKFQTRFQWAEIPSRPIKGKNTYKEVLTELIEVIGLSVYVLWTAWTGGGRETDLRYAAKWVEMEIKELQGDWTRYRLALKYLESEKENI